ncbi:MAG: hypothetical protein GEV28_17395 [Actinophytocola sp.]|uniref:hypothetical protein n=1 Tax=Actinophytocola sp. TaxID=1872138 RepID=UPI0013227979|nr:hypothetical protein [Actinophytocola sp.]MPZ82066.1 hypothetical protein [Actinophytocola sp.]
MTNDGTQDPGPPPVLADPLAGLVTGGRYEPEPLRVRVVEPSMPDISAVRAAMANVLDEDSELNLGPVAPVFDSDLGTGWADPSTGGIPTQAAPRAAEQATPAADPPVAKVPVSQVPVTRVPRPAAIPAQRSRPRGAVPPARVRPPAILAEKTRRIRVPRGFTPSQTKPLPGTKGKGKGTSSAASVALIMALLLVIAVIAIVFLVSFIDTISSIFS